MYWRLSGVHLQLFLMLVWQDQVWIIRPIPMWLGIP
jgi:hypothetical protein